jgi:N-acetylmuramoyl-L-alanine amidase
MEKRTVTDFIIVHHSATDRDSTTFASIKNYHINNNGWNNVGYHKVIEASGKIYDGMPEGNVGYHCLHDGFNYKSVAVCLTGNFQDQKPTEKQLASLKQILDEWRAKYNIPRDKVLGHKETGASTSCPGNNLIPFLQNYRKGNDMDFLKEDIPTEVEDKFKLKDIKRYNKYWTYEEFFKDWVNLVSEYDELKERSKKEALELTKRVSELDKVRVSLQKDINSLEANLMALEALRVKQGEESLEKHQELQKQYEEVSSAHEDLLEAYTNLQLDLDAGYADQISRLKKTIKDQERRILQLQRPRPSVGEAFELLIEALREAIIK